MVRVIFTAVFTTLALMSISASADQGPGTKKSAWASERVFTYRADDGRLHTGHWRVLEASLWRCQNAASRADNHMRSRYSGGRYLGSKRFTPCHRINLKSSPY